MILPEAVNAIDAVIPRLSFTVTASSGVMAIYSVLLLNMDVKFPLDNFRHYSNSENQQDQGHYKKPLAFTKSARIVSIPIKEMMS